MFGKPAGLSKRFLSITIDFLCVLALFVLITVSLNSIFYKSSGLERLTNNYSIKYKELGLIYQDQYNLGVYDDKKKEFIFDKRFDKNDENYGGVKLEDDEDYKACINDPVVKQITNDLHDLQLEITNIRSIFFVVSVTISGSIFLLVIPLLNKYNQSLGRRVTKLALVKKYDVLIDKKTSIIRFAAMLLVEIYGFYFLLSYIQNGATMALMIPFVSFSIMCFNKNKITLHDLIASTKVVEIQASTIFNTIEERNAKVEELNAKQLSDKTKPSTDLEFLDNQD